MPRGENICAFLDQNFISIAVTTTFLAVTTCVYRYIFTYDVLSTTAQSSSLYNLMCFTQYLLVIIAPSESYNGKICNNKLKSNGH